MGTVGLSFGSATSGQGFDVSTTVASIISIQQGIETPWKSQLTSLGSEATAFSTLGTDLSTLSTSMQTLTDFEGVLAEKEGSSSNTDALELTSADSTASAGSHQITVSQLAQTSSVFTSPISNSSDTLSGSLSIQVGSGTAQTITIGSTSDTLSTLAAAINSAGIGVTASVISDNSGSRLSIVSDTSGAAGQLTVSASITDTANSNAAVTTEAGETGQDAQLTVDGISVDSGSNTISTAIPGVTFQLLATSSSPIQVEIANNTTDITTAMTDFVSSYNQLVTDMNTQEGDDASGNAEPLFGDPTLSMIQSTMSQALMGGAASGSISSLTQLGITVNDDGTLTMSSSQFSDVLNSHFNDFVGFMQNTGSFGNNFTSALNGVSSTDPTGAVYLAQQDISTQESTLNADISNEESLLTTQRSTLTTELNTANQELQSIPSQLNEVNEMYSAVTGYNESTQ